MPVRIYKHDCMNKL